MRKQSKQSISLIQRKIWVECKRIIRARYKHICFTCDRSVDGSNMHTGHFIPKASCGAVLKYNLDNLRIQCYNCNINLGGNGAEFYKRLVKKEGQEFVNKLFSLKNKTVKAYDFYLELLEKYKKIK